MKCKEVEEAKKSMHKVMWECEIKEAQVWSLNPISNKATINDNDTAILIWNLFHFDK